MTLIVSQSRSSSDDLQDVWGKDLVYAVIDDGPRRMTKTLGYEIRKAGTQPRQVRRWANNEPADSETINVIDNYDQLLLNTECAYLIKDAVA